MFMSNIYILTKMLTLKDKDLEKIHISKFKNLKNELALNS